jgi:glycosyltransferase involved in cell wall biosynthesis
MSTGLPVIATNVGGISEVMVEDCGTLVPADEPEEMAKAILELSETELSAQKTALRSIAEQSFSWETNVKSLMQIYEELI